MPVVVLAFFTQPALPISLSPKHYRSGGRYPLELAKLEFTSHRKNPLDSIVQSNNSSSVKPRSSTALRQSQFEKFLAQKRKHLTTTLPKNKKILSLVIAEEFEVFFYFHSF